MSIQNKAVESAQKLIKQAQNIVITNHVGPDADAMGAALGLQLFLHQVGKEAQVVVPNGYADVLNFLPGSREVLVFEQSLDAAQLVNNADLIFHLDYNAYSRSGAMETALRQSKAKRILIDHHQQPEDWPDVLYSDTSMSSTCEMIYHFAEALNWLPVMNAAIATSLYAGIMTDTGNFKFSATSPTTHRVVANLLEAGAVPQEIANAVYDSNTRDRLKLLSRALENMEVFEQEKTVLMPLSREDLDMFQYKKGDTEGFVNYGLSIQGTVLSIFMKEDEGKIKLSFRSKGNFDVNQLARDYFEGGGHKNAAGGVSYKSLDETVRYAKELLPEIVKRMQEEPSFEVKK
jgi:phosphoesterase RecJ-like protein